MPFFLPEGLTEFEYFETDNKDQSYIEKAKPYRRDIDFAFFAANFGFSKREYEELTPRELHFLYKEYENRQVAQLTSVYNAVFTATYNVNRGKKRRALKLLKKKAVAIDKQQAENDEKLIREIEKKEQGWYEKLCKANGFGKEK